MQEALITDGPLSPVDLAASAGVSLSEMNRLLRSPSPAVRSVLAGNPCLPEQLQRLLREDPSPAVTRYLLGNPSLAPRLQEFFLKRNLAIEVETLAGNAGLTSQMQHLLVTSSHPGVVERLASTNPALLPEVQFLLGRHSTEAVRYALATNKYASHMHDTLAGDVSWRVRSAVARSPVVSPAVVAVLSFDESLWKVLQENHHSPLREEDFPGKELLDVRAAFLHAHHLPLLLRFARKCASDAEMLLSLAANWEGSLGELLVLTSRV